MTEAERIAKLFPNTDLARFAEMADKTMGRIFEAPAQRTNCVFCGAELAPDEGRDYCPYHADDGSDI